MEQAKGHDNIELYQLEQFQYQRGSFLLNESQKQSAGEVVIGLSPTQIFQAFQLQYEPYRTDLRLLWFKANESDCSRVIDYLSILDADIPIVRVSTSARAAAENEVIFCVEANPHHELSPEVVEQHLTALKLVEEPSNIELIHDMSIRAYETPSMSNVSRFNYARSKILAECPQIKCLNSLNPFGRNSFTDQVLDGLHLATQEKNDV